MATLVRPCVRRSSTSRSRSDSRSRRPPLTGSIRLDTTFGSSADPKRRRMCGLDMLREHAYAADRATALLTQTMRALP